MRGLPMNDPTIKLTFKKQPNGQFKITTDTENGWANCGGLTCTVFYQMPDNRIVLVLEPPPPKTMGH